MRRQTTFWMPRPSRFPLHSSALLQSHIFIVCLSPLKRFLDQHLSERHSPSVCTHTRSSFFSMLWCFREQEARNDRMYRKTFICGDRTAARSMNPPVEVCQPHFDRAIRTHRHHHGDGTGKAPDQRVVHGEPAEVGVPVAFGVQPHRQAWRTKTNSVKSSTLQKQNAKNVKRLEKESDQESLNSKRLRLKRCFSACGSLVKMKNADD